MTSFFGDLEEVNACPIGTPVAFTNPAALAEAVAGAFCSAGLPQERNWTDRERTIKIAGIVQVLLNDTSD